MSKIVEQHVPCPVCPSSDAYCVYDDGHGHCFSCNYHLNPKDFNLTDTLFTYEFLPLRGIDKATMKFYNVKAKIDAEGKPLSLGFVYPNESMKIRNLEQKDFYSQGDIAKAGLFGRNLWEMGSHKYVTITEGELDALSLYQTIRGPVVSVQSASTAGRDCVVDRAWLNSFERVYLAFDNDESGRRATAEVAKLFDYDKVYHVRFTKHKDANDFLIAGERDELANLWHNSKRYIPENIVSSLDEFKAAVREAPLKGFDYPSKTLTEMTEGIRFGETVLITAQTGVGKTEFMHAVEYKLLKESDYRIGTIYLEETKRKHLQALAGLELGKDVSLANSGCTPDQVIDAVQRVVVEDDRLFIYDHYGSDDPEVLLESIRFLVAACGCRVVMLDHISMVVSGSSEKDERKGLDRIMTKLEMMVKELDFALIVVSHVNDFGQTRGSRYIEKISHIRIDISRDVMSEDPVKRQTAVFTIPKNRPAKKTGPAGKLYFNFTTNRYEELDDDTSRGSERRIEEMAA